MPKTAIHKNNSSVFTKYYIRMTGKPWMIQPIAEASVKKKFPYQYFGFRILSTYSCHITMTLFFGLSIHINTKDLLLYSIKESLIFLTNYLSFSYFASSNICLIYEDASDTSELGVYIIPCSLSSALY